MAIFVFLSCFSYAQRDTVIVRPVAINDVLINPNLGITTFNRFNGQATNPPLEWSEVGPVTRVAAGSNEGDFPETTIAYLRLVLECARTGAGENPVGHHRSSHCGEVRAHGQTLAIRLMPYSTRILARVVSEIWCTPSQQAHRQRWLDLAA